MFENEVNNQGAPSQNTADVPLFENYEMKGWKVSPRVYQILAFSAIFNIVAIIGIGQSNLLTIKGCDSPLIGSVCQVLDTVYVGSKLYGTESGYVDEAYNPTDLSGSEEIVYLDLTGQDPPLTYPANYWEIANPERFQAQPDGSIPGIEGFPGFSGSTSGGIQAPVSSGTNDLEKQRQVLPENKGPVVQGNLPSGFDTDVDGNTGDTVAGIRPGKRNGFGQLNQGKPTKTPGKYDGFPQLKPTPTPEKTPDEDLTALVLNKAPLLALGAKIDEQVKNNQLNLLAPVNVQGKGKLLPDGKIEKETFQYGVAPGSDPAMALVVRQAIEALNDSGHLQYLRDLTGKSLDLSVIQDDKEFTATVQSEMESERRAKSVKTILDLVIKYYKDKKSVPEADENDKDDLALLNAATVVTEGKKIVISFKIGKPEAQALIQRKLQIKRTDEPAKPQSTAQTSGANPTNGK